MKRCPLCGREATAHLPLQHTTVYKCTGTECRLLFSDPQLDDASLIRAYQQHYYPTNGGAASYENTPKEILRQTFDQVSSQFGPLSGKKLLDYGCGNGTLCQIARDFGVLTTGIEPDLHARNMARKSGTEDVYANLEELRNAQPLARFDLVSLWDVIEHLRSPWNELRDLTGLVEVGGSLLLSTMNTGCLRARLERGRWSNMVNTTHFYYFTRKSLTSVLARAGFGNVEELQFPLYYPHHGLAQRVMNDVLRALRLQGQLIFAAQRQTADRAAGAHVDV